MQTNSIDEGLGTNWVNVSGSDATNQIFIPLNTTYGGAFFALLIHEDSVFNPAGDSNSAGMTYTRSLHLGSVNA